MSNLFGVSLEAGRQKDPAADRDVAGSGQRLKVKSRKNRRDRFRLLLLILNFSYPVAKIIIRI